MNEVDARREKVIRRLRYLWTGELFSSVFMPAVLLFLAREVEQPVGAFPLYSVILVTLFLWEGSAWWWLKLREVRRGIPITARHLRWFALFKRANWLLLGLLPLALGADIWRYGRLRLFAVLAGGALYLLAFLEQINYYYVQLMYDNAADLRWLARHKRLKRAKLAQALDRLTS